MSPGKRPFLLRAGFSLAGVLILAALVWWLGPFLTWLEPAGPRVVLMLLLLAGWFGAIGWLLWRTQKDEAALVGGLLGTEARSEADVLEGRFADAIDRLRRAGGAGALNRQPWYVIIGPPGAGKTTALLNAGLTFPLTGDLGAAPVAGVGGTRHCDWWFTDQAVLIDTAGRYTSQDSDAAADRAGWQTFLELLARTRKRQPLNGVIVALPILDIAGASREARVGHARTVRDRLAELEATLRVRLPVYLLLTKADLVAGFTEFFDDLDADRRGQVWGTTFPLPPRSAPLLLDTPAALALLVGRLQARVLDRLQSERSAERRVLIANFPDQVASLIEPLTSFVADAFADSKLKRAPLLRGIYLTSGTQEGTPVDRLTGLLSRAFGVDQRRVASLRPEGGRSYFLHRLLAQVLPGEAMLVADRPETTRRRRLLRAGAFAATLLATLAACGALWRQHNVAMAQQSTLGRALDSYAQEAARHRLDPVADSDLPGLLPFLERARSLPFGAGQDGPAELAALAHSAYEHALGRALLPRLVRRLEGQIAMALNQNRPDFAYEATRIYLMLGGAGPLDVALVREWMRQDWAAVAPQPETRERLLAHLDALLATPLPAVDLDGTLVDRARATFNRISPAARVYARLRSSPAAQNLSPWRPREALGALGAGLFVRASGTSLDAPVPGFLTGTGFREVLLPMLAPAITMIASENWVLGARTGMVADPAALEAQVVGLYEDEFIRTWDALLNDLQLAPLKSVSQSAQDLFVLAAPESPLRRLLAAVVRQVTVAEPGSLAGKGGAAPEGTSALSTLLRTAAPVGGYQPGARIMERYRPLRELVGAGPGAPIDAALRSWTEVQQLLARANATASGTPAASPGGASPGGASAALRLEAQHWPDPLRRWMTAMADGAANLLGAGNK